MFCDFYLPVVELALVRQSTQLWLRITYHDSMLWSCEHLCVVATVTCHHSSTLKPSASRKNATAVPFPADVGVVAHA